MATTHGRHLVATTLVLLAATSAGLVAAMADSDRQGAEARSGAPSAGAAAVEVSTNDCGSGWVPAPAGAQEIVVPTAAPHAGALRVGGVDAGNGGQVFAELESFGPATTLTLRVRLAAGQYALQCLFEEQAPVTGPARTVTGDAGGVRGVVPMPQD